MASNRTTLKAYFEPGDRPKAVDFADLIDSSLNIIEDKATDTQAEDQAVDNKYLTPKTAKKSVEKFAPVKKVNGKNPNPATAEVSLVIADIPNLVSSLASKQDTLTDTTLIKINGATLLGPGTMTLPTVADLNAKPGFPVVTRLAAAITSSSTTRADVTSFATAAGKKYKIEILGDYQTAALTTGGSIGFVLSAGTGNIKGIVEMQTTATTYERKIISAISTTVIAGSFMSSTQVPLIASPQILTASVFFDCLTAGSLKIQWGSEVAASAATLNAGTFIVITPLN
jgi:hypothetical protein